MGHHEGGAGVVADEATAGQVTLDLQGEQIPEDVRRNVRRSKNIGQPKDRTTTDPISDKIKQVYLDVNIYYFIYKFLSLLRLNYWFLIKLHWFWENVNKSNVFLSMKGPFFLH